MELSPSAEAMKALKKEFNLELTEWRTIFGSSLGLSTQEMAEVLLLNPQSILRAKPRACRKLGEPSFAIVIMRIFEREDVRGLESFNGYPDSIEGRLAAVKTALDNNGLEVAEITELLEPIRRYPTNRETAWEAKYAPAIVREIIAQAGLAREKIALPYLLVLAAAAASGHITSAMVPPLPPEPLGTVEHTFESGQTISVTGPHGATAVCHYLGERAWLVIP